jgi:hypothetical protein
VIVQDIKLIPTKAMTQDAEIVTLMLSDLPFVPKLDLQQNFYEILGKYGQVVEVLLFTDRDSGFFFGNGMAILNRTVPQEAVQAEGYDEGVPHYAALTHNMDYYGKKRLHAKWRNMPQHCVYCHSEEHVVADCDERPKIRCWNCHAFGHVSAKCPQKNVMKTRKKPKHQHRVEEFSESEDEIFEQDLAKLGDKAEQALKERQQNDLNNGDSTEPKNIPEEEKIDDEDFNTSELSSLEEDELKLLGEEEEEDVDMDYLNKAIQEENDDPMDTEEAANKGNQDKNNSITAPTKKENDTWENRYS